MEIDDEDTEKCLLDKSDGWVEGYNSAFKMDFDKHNRDIDYIEGYHAALKKLYKGAMK